MHWADGSQVKVRRARKHFDELHGAVRSWFVEGRDYEKVPVDDPITGDEVLRLHWLQQPPLLDWGGIAGDVIHNLRSALDIAVHQLILVRSGSRTTRGFPVFPDQRTADAAPLADIARCSRATVEIIKEANRRSAPVLRLLQALDNNGKHHVLTTVTYGLLYVTLEISPAGARLLYPDGLTSPRGIAMAQRVSNLTRGSGVAGAEGSVLGRTPAELRGKIVLNPQLQFEVAINEPDITGALLIRTLYDQLVLVEDIIGQLAAIPEG